MEKKLLIAIDGPSASGKGTISKLLSEKFNIPHLNTGGLYRGVAYKAHQQNVNLDDEKAVIEVAKTLNEEDINITIATTIHDSNGTSCRGECVGSLRRGQQ